MVYGISDYPTYPTGLIGEGGRAEERRALSLSKKINDIRDMLIDDREDCRINHGLATGAMELLDDAANKIDMGFPAMTSLEDSYNLIKDYPKYEVEVRQIIEAVQVTCDHDWVDASTGEGDCIEQRSYCKKCNLLIGEFGEIK